MSLPQTSKFQVFEEKADTKVMANYFSKNVLLSYYDKVKNVTDLTRMPMEWIDTYRPSLSNDYASFYDWFVNTKKVREVQTDNIEWKLRTRGQFKPSIRENITPELTQPGIRNGTFPIKLDTGNWVQSDVIYPEIAPEAQLFITENPIADSSADAWIYNVQFIGAANHFFPVECLAAGTRFCKLDASHSEASKLYGSFEMNGLSYIHFRSNIGKLNKKLQVTDEAHLTNLKIQKIDESGVPVDPGSAKIINTLEVEFFKQIRNEKAKRIWMGRSGSAIDPSTGYKIQFAPGVTEFLEDGNVDEYPLDNISIDYFQDAIDSRWFDTVPWANREIVLWTGTGGLRQWESMIARKYHGYGAQLPFDKVAYPTQSGKVPGSKMDTYGFNKLAFTEWPIFPGGVIKIGYLPILDSRELNGHRLHPRTGLPLSSYEYIAIDYGISDGGPNVELLHKENSEAVGYLCGTWSPVGALKTMSGSDRGFNITHSGRYYELLYSDTVGVYVRDISRTMWFKPAYN